MRQGKSEILYERALYEEDIWTYQDYLDLPNDGKIYEIIGGTLQMAPAPTSRHQKVSRNLEYVIWDYVKKHNLGEIFDAPIDVILDKFNVVQPDLIYISKERIHIIQERGIFGAPNLIIEIISPYNAKVDLKRKKELYERFAVREYWVVDPMEKKIEVYLMQGGKYLPKGVYLEQDIIESNQIAGLTLPLGEVF